jgi:hypothetical protein
MWQTVIAGLIVAAFGGLAFLAYNHLDTYKIISFVLSAIIVIALLIMDFFSFSYAIGFYAAKSDTDPRIPSETLPFSVHWINAGCLGFLLYLLLLGLLVQFIKTYGKNDADKDEPPKRKRS